METTYETLIEEITAWAGREENVRAAVIIGSRARSDHPADEWSDLDVILVAHDPGPCLQDKGWLEAIGHVWLSFVERSADGRTMEHRVLFSGGLDVDFAFLPAADFEAMLAAGLPPEVGQSFGRGSRVLVDKDNLVGRLLEMPLEQAPAQPPELSEFLNTVHDFWYHTLWTAKHLRRGELWWAKMGCDIRLKMLLQQMLEWHARATRGQEIDTWLRGRFLEEWADPRAVAELSTAFGHYEALDIWHALLCTMALFRWLERETAAALQFRYSDEGQREAAGLVRALFEGQ